MKPAPMLEKLSLDDEKIAACLQAAYGLRVTEIEFLPLGYDSYAGVYRVRSRGQDYFLKARRDPVDDLSLSIPRYLKAQGIEQVIAPLPTITQQPYGTVEGFSLLLYPFIAGQSGMQAGLTEAQWREYGAVLKRIHTVPLPPHLLSRLPREDFTLHPKWSAVVRQLQDAVPARACDSPAEGRLAAFWREKHQEIELLLARAGALGRVLREKALDFVLCHADIHTANLLLDQAGRLFVVDWDQPVLAPAERDLLFVTLGGFVTDARHEALFFQGYGRAERDLLALTYYRYARVIEDLGGFGDQVFFLEGSDESKQDAVDWCIRQFEPGGMAEAAHQYDALFFR